MFPRRHPWTLALATAISGAIFSAMKPSFDRLASEVPLRILLYCTPFVVIWFLFYLLVRGVEQEGSNQLVGLKQETQVLRGEKEILQGQLRSSQERASELERRPPATLPAMLDIDSLNAIWFSQVTTDEVSDFQYDPIYGVISIDEKLLRILRQPIVQRLSHIHQLSFSYLTFPTATHSRLAHSLGVCKISELALSGILARNDLYSAQWPNPREIDVSLDDREKLLFKCRLAGMLHDLGHGPFGHGLDKYVGFCEAGGVKLTCPPKTVPV